MKKLLIFFSLLIIAACSNAQNKDTIRKALPIPKYRILTTDSVWVTPANLKKDKPVMIVYFSPDCSHCQRMMFELKPKLKQIANVQIIMITWSLKYDIRAMKIFKRDYDLKKYPNVIIGTEGYTAFAQQYYKISTTPFIAMYHAGGKWAKYFDKTPKSEDVLAAAKKL